MLYYDVVAPWAYYDDKYSSISVVMEMQSLAAFIAYGCEGLS